MCRVLSTYTIKHDGSRFEKFLNGLTLRQSEQINEDKFNIRYQRWKKDKKGFRGFSQTVNTSYASCIGKNIITNDNKFIF